MKNSDEIEANDKQTIIYSVRRSNNYSNLLQKNILQLDNDLLESIKGDNLEKSLKLFNNWQNRIKTKSKSEQIVEEIFDKNYFSPDTGKSLVQKKVNLTKA